MSRAARTRHLSVARGLLSCPTAPFLEDSPASFVRAFARRRAGVSLAEDRYGNLAVKFPGRGRPKAPPLVLVAHLDHPGFVVDSVEDGLAHLSFRGGVRIRHARPGSRLHFFRAGGRNPVGSGRLLSASGRGARRAGFLGSGVAKVTSGRAVPGGFTMWAWPGWSVRGKRIVSRCLDDLLGAAAALAALDELLRLRPRGANVWALFTRAEEVGFLGTLGAIRAKTLPRGARVISLETSRALPSAPPGAGVILRVGDARSVFDSRLTLVAQQAAGELAAEGDGFRVQRRLMDGGACEATAFCAAGFRSTGLALPLVNYHNMKGLDRGKPGIGPEAVRMEDYFSMVSLLVRLGEWSGGLAAREGETDRWLKALSRTAHRDLLERPLLPEGRSGKGRCR
ncbi:MAG: hypothetical protein QF819_00750 [Gemmatimonadota bacterium]|jgi:endoglucanase|nr:hypothetical protein [Gemmatimonadota bacterium]MDP6801694.1 hypothetical protein [Gemmatimonadota bacterium]MDP7031230.1 hypothetical protein [Gemmatimonadota bacterium]